MNADWYAVRTFEDFWPHYVALHTRRATQVAHALATLSCLALLVAAAVVRQPVLAVAGPIVDYAIAQASHRVFEGNRTTPWKNQLWHTRAELRMLRLVITGRALSASCENRALVGCLAELPGRAGRSAPAGTWPRGRPPHMRARNRLT
jgi:hypothetical protein